MRCILIWYETYKFYQQHKLAVLFFPRILFYKFILVIHKFGRKCELITEKHDRFHNLCGFLE